jgi:hypothetical protein
VQQDVPQLIHNYTDRQVPDMGQAFIFPLLLQFNQHFLMKTFEAAGSDHKHNTILPEWWNIKHLLGN